MKIENNRDVSVPQQFFKLLPSLTEVQLKVYLMVIGSDDSLCDEEAIASALGLSKSDVIAALCDLSGEGLISYSTDFSGMSETVVKIIRSDAPLSSAKQSLTVDPTLREIFKRVEQITGKIISVRTADLIINALNRLYLPADVILEAFEISAAKGICNDSYISTILYDWGEKCIKTVEAARSYSSSKGRFPDVVYKALPHLGRYDAPTESEAEIIGHWVNDLRFDDDVIIFACNITAARTSKNRLLYCDRILSDWAAKGVHSLEDAKETFGGRRKHSPFGMSNKSLDFDELEKQLLDN